MNIVIINIVANPFTVDSPNTYNTIPAINVVILASIMAPKLFFPPSLKAAYVFSPLASSSLTLSLEIIIKSLENTSALNEFKNKFTKINEFLSSYYKTSLLSKVDLKVGDIENIFQDILCDDFLDG